MSHNSIDLKAYLHSRGSRMTLQRQMILDAICAQNGTARLDDIFSLVNNQAPAVNLTTVYRNLDFLTRIGLVARIQNLQGEAFYEIALGKPHHHLICRQCSGQIEMAGDDLADTAHKIRKLYDFAVEFDHLTLYGICRACLQDSPGALV